MNYNSFGRKIKDTFSLTFKKDEEKIKLYLNEKVTPVAYIKQLILNDMNKCNDSEINLPPNNIEDDNYSNFNFEMED